MDYSVHNYAGDGVEADWQFRADRIFASDVLAFVKGLPQWKSLVSQKQPADRPRKICCDLCYQ